MISDLEDRFFKTFNLKFSCLFCQTFNFQFLGFFAALFYCFCNREVQNVVSNNLKILYCEATDFFTTSETASFSISILSFRVAEVVRRHEGPSPKSLDSDENFKP